MWIFSILVFYETISETGIKDFDEKIEFFVEISQRQKKMFLTLLGGCLVKRYQYLVCVLVLVVVLFAITGCATLFHSDRASMTPDQRGGIDVGMFILDIFWFPWGWIVDFITGCIWLPR
jgi:hypothetical protein